MDILDKFAEFLEKQDIICKLTENQKLHNYGYSEIHTIRAIGTLDEPNVTEIAKSLKMTRGAICKITKKLIAKGLIETYMLSDNKQKVFFNLTNEGKVLFDEHEIRHNLWVERDNKFLENFPRNQLNAINSFMEQYNNYLEQKIQELSKE